jgi:hypothetical protein
VLHIPLLCFHYIVVQNDGTVFNLFASSGLKFPLGLKFHKLETTKNEAKFGYVLLWNDCQTHDLPHKFEKYNTACIQLKKS